MLKIIKKMLHRNKKQINYKTGLIPDDYDNRDYYIDDFGNKHIPCKQDK